MTTIMVINTPPSVRMVEGVGRGQHGASSPGPGWVLAALRQVHSSSRAAIPSVWGVCLGLSPSGGSPWSHLLLTSLHRCAPWPALRGLGIPFKVRLLCPQDV